MANNDDMSSREAAMYTDIARYGATVIAITVFLTFIGFVTQDCNEHNTKNQPEFTKQLQEKQKLETLCLASSCPQGQYRVFTINVNAGSAAGSCYCDVRVIK